jgi:REP element-mobilizing transposase RayT
MSAKQANIFDYFDTHKTRKRYGRTQHGGVETKGHRKLERPLSTTRPIHLVLKSHRAKGSLSFLTHKNKPVVEGIIRGKARKFGVRICQFANVGNHLHLKIRIASRPLFQAFLVSVTTLIARTLTSARRGKKFGRFWCHDGRNSIYLATSKPIKSKAGSRKRQESSIWQDSTAGSIGRG